VLPAPWPGLSRRKRRVRLDRVGPSWSCAPSSERSSHPLELLAAAEAASSSSSLGIRPLTAPLPIDRLRVHSRRPRPPSGRRCHPSSSFRPRGFSPPRRLSPRRGCRFVAPCCRLWGSTRCPLRLPDRPKAPCKTVAFPAPHFIPFEEFPSSAAAPHHCGRCLPVITARPSRPNQLDRSRAHSTEVERGLSSRPKPEELA
jgi:hypothetical protein